MSTSRTRENASERALEDEEARLAAASLAAGDPPGGSTASTPRAPWEEYPSRGAAANRTRCSPNGRSATTWQARESGPSHHPGRRRPADGASACQAPRGSALNSTAMTIWTDAAAPGGAG